MSSKKPLTRTLKEGKDWTEAWQSKHKNLAKAFRIPIDDLVACFNEMNVSFTIDANTNELQIVPGAYPASVRAYLGIDYGGEQKLLIVGNTTTDGLTYKDMVTDSSGDSLIYDFTTPCPNDCDPGSALNHQIK